MRLGRIEPIKQQVNDVKKPKLWTTYRNHFVTSLYAGIVCVGIGTSALILYELRNHLFKPKLENIVFNEVAGLVKNSEIAKQELGRPIETKLSMIYQNPSLIHLDMAARGSKKQGKVIVVSTVRNSAQHEYSIDKVTLITSDKELVLLEKKLTGIFGFNSNTFRGINSRF
jgi:hypothetical protein